MGQTSLTFFTGVSALSPQLAARELASGRVNLRALEGDLIFLREHQTLEEPILLFLNALREGKIRRAKTISQQDLATAIAQLPLEEWRGIIQQTQATSIFAPSAQVTASLQRRLNEGLALSNRLEAWEAKVERFNEVGLHQSEADEVRKVLVREFIDLIKNAAGIEELVAVIEAGRSGSPFGVFWSSEGGVQSALRRAILKFWTPGVILPMDVFFIELSKLFELDTFWRHDNKEDRVWIEEHIAPLKEFEELTLRPHQRAWELIRSGNLPLQEKMLAAMVLLMPPRGYYRNHYIPPDFQEYLEGRVEKGELDLVDLKLASDFAYYSHYESPRLSWWIYSRRTQEALLQMALELTPWSRNRGEKSVPFPHFFDERVILGFPDDLQYKLVRTVYERGIATRDPELNCLIPDDVLKKFSTDQIESLLQLYQKDPETAVRHGYNLLTLVKKLPLEKQRRYQTIIISLFKPQWVDKYAAQLRAFFEFIPTSLLEHDEVEAMIPAMVQIAERSNRLNHESKKQEEALFGLHQDAVRFVLTAKRDPKKREKPWALELVPYFEGWFERKIINFLQLLLIFREVAPYQEEGWVTHILGKILLLFTNPNPRSPVYSNSSELDDLNRELKRAPITERPRLLEPLRRAYFQNPFSEGPAWQQKTLLEMGLGIEAVPPIETKAGLAKVIEYSRLDAGTKEKVSRLVFNEAHPLTPAWNLMVAKAITTFDSNELLFFKNITMATPADGMVYEWILLLRDLLQLGNADRVHFAIEQNSRFTAHGNPANLTPPRIRKTLRYWLRQRFIARLGLSKKEAQEFQAHYARFTKAWLAKGFLNHLSAMASFVDEKGLKAIKTVVMGIVHSPVEVGADDFSFAFRWRGLEKHFGAKFIAEWKKKRVYTLSRSKPLSPEEAKAKFARRVARQIAIHLSPYLSQHFDLLQAKILLPENFGVLANDLKAIYASLKDGKYPERERVEAVIRTFDIYKQELQSPAFTSLREIRNDLSELLRGWNRSFDSTDPGRVTISGDPRDIVRAGVIGQKTCTRPTDPAAGNNSAQPAGRAVHGPLLIAIIERDGAEIGRTLLEVVPQEGGNHLTIWPLYVEGGFADEEALAEIFIEYSKGLGIPEERVHNAFTGKNMEQPPTLLPARFETYAERFNRPNAKAAVSP